ncbi:hypothetical protein, partial [Salmonella enterica]|uniref:hypothetical protein n=1 Tax=Salmonella enterica TaxID=28901 RepID=UPI001C3D3013
GITVKDGTDGLCPSYVAKRLVQEDCVDATSAVVTRLRLVVSFAGQDRLCLPGNNHLPGGE